MIDSDSPFEYAVCPECGGACSDFSRDLESFIVNLGGGDWEVQEQYAEGEIDDHELEDALEEALEEQHDEDGKALEMEVDR